MRTRKKLEKMLYFASSDEKGIIEVTERFADILAKNAPLKEFFTSIQNGAATVANP